VIKKLTDCLPMNMPSCASTGPVLATNGMFTGLVTLGIRRGVTGTSSGKPR